MMLLKASPAVLPYLSRHINSYPSAGVWNVSANPKDEMLLVLGDSKRNMHNIILWLLKINNYVNNLGLMSKERLINLDRNSRSPETIRVCSSLVEHTSRNHRYTSHAAPLSTPASLAASVTGDWRAHQYIYSRNHCWSVRRELLKNLSSLIVFLPLHVLHHQLTPSETSGLGLSVIGIPPHLN